MSEPVKLRNTIFLTLSISPKASVNDAIGILVPDITDSMVCATLGLDPECDLLQYRVGVAPSRVWDEVAIEGLTRKDWQTDVAAGNTAVGYREWFASAFDSMAGRLLSGDAEW